MDEVFARVASFARKSLRFERMDSGISSPLEMPVRIRSVSVLRRLEQAGFAVRTYNDEFGPAPIEITEADFARLISLCRRILVNMGVDAARKQRAAERFESSRRSVAIQADPSTVAVEREAAARLRRVLATLPARDRRLLTEYLVDGSTLPTMALRRGVSVSTLSRQIQHILWRLREAIGE